MISTTRIARVTGPMPYTTPAGKRANIPLGPCLVEPVDDQRVDIVWGLHGQRSAPLSFAELTRAEQGGSLVLLE